MSAKDAAKVAIATAAMVANLYSDPVDNPQRNYKNYDRVQRNERQWEQNSKAAAESRNRDKHGKTK